MGQDLRSGRAGHLRPAGDGEHPHLGWRRRRLDEYPTDEIPDSPAADATGDSDLHDVVQRAVDRLPRQMRAAVMLRFYDDMTEPEVAAALGVSVGTVKSTVARAVAKLRKDAELGADAELGGGFSS